MIAMAEPVELSMSLHDRRERKQYTIHLGKRARSSGHPSPWRKSLWAEILPWRVWIHTPGSTALFQRHKAKIMFVYRSGNSAPGVCTTLKRIKEPAIYPLSIGERLHLIMQLRDGMDVSFFVLSPSASQNVLLSLPCEHCRAGQSVAGKKGRESWLPVNSLLRLSNRMHISCVEPIVDSASLEDGIPK